MVAFINLMAKSGSDTSESKRLYLANSVTLSQTQDRTKTFVKTALNLLTGAAVKNRNMVFEVTH